MDCKHEQRIYINEGYQNSGRKDLMAPTFRIGFKIADMKRKLESEMKQVDTDIEGLNKKLHYLEMTAKNSQEHIEAMLRRGPSGS